MLELSNSATSVPGLQLTGKENPSKKVWNRMPLHFTKKRENSAMADARNKRIHLKSAISCILACHSRHSEGETLQD